MKTTNIEWCDSTASPWYWYSKVSPQKSIGMFEASCRSLNRQAEREGRRLRVFPSLCDWLDQDVPVGWLADALEVMRAYQHLDFLLLTKRPALFRERVEFAQGWIIDGCDVCDRWLFRWLDGCAPENIWVGVSCEDQQRANERIPALLRIPARVRFVSCEPLLGKIDLTAALWWETGPHSGRRNQIQWVIVGGEFGPEARLCNVEWVRDIVRQCKDAGVPCFVKQLGSFPCISGPNALEIPDLFFDNKHKVWRISVNHPKGGDPGEWPEDLRVREWLIANSQRKEMV